MDDIVKAALAKWPNVPHCHGWLALDARGHWHMRDDRVQAAGPFPAVKGSRIDHDKLLAFIHRNYERDPRGCWFFQNGPQRVYVELEITPWIWRVGVGSPGGGSGGSSSGAAGSSGSTPCLTAHTGLAASRIDETLLDEQGRLYAATDLGLGLVHTQDMHVAADLVERGDWSPRAVTAATLPQRFGYVLSPQAYLTAASM